VGSYVRGGNEWALPERRNLAPDHTAANDLDAEKANF
jgi:hypothetical protein